MATILRQSSLTDMINWPLNQKVDHSLYIIDSFIAQNPNCVVSFSGGLDSTVLLHLTRIIDKNRKGIYVNTTNELREIVSFCKETENIDIIFPKLNFKQTLEKYGFPLISKRQARYIYDIKHTKSEKLKAIRLGTGFSSLSKKWRFLVGMSFDVSDKCCDVLKKNPLRPFTKEGVLIGTKVSDSVLRKIAYYKNGGCININGLRATPLSIWTDEDIWRFIKITTFPIVNYMMKE